MMAASERTKKFAGSHLTIGDKKFEVVSDFVHLGSIISNNFDISLLRLSGGFWQLNVHSLEFAIYSRQRESLDTPN
jgi:hypothetical protein